MLEHIGAFGNSPYQKWPVPLRLPWAVPRSDYLFAIIGAAIGGALGFLLFEGLATLALPALGGVALPEWARQGLVLVLSFALGAIARSLVKEVVGLFVASVFGGIVGLAILFALPLAIGNRLDNWHDALMAIIVILFGWLGAIVMGLAHMAWIVFRKVPKNYNGIVRGHDPKWNWGLTPHPEREPRMLTDWLSMQIDKIAGLDTKTRDGKRHPLTFGDLCSKEITLRMVSTNLNQGLPYELPFRDNIFLFKKSEMEDLFPKYIVDYMVETSGEIHRYKAGTDGHAHNIDQDHFPKDKDGKDQYFFAPRPDRFPVAVAMRMSLAVPIFISAIPFYTITESGLERLRQGRDLREPEETKRQKVHNDIQQNWFSDGGTTSNFPIHFFDNWLPTRPTFGINLTAMPAEAIQGEHLDRSYLSVIHGTFSGTDEHAADEDGDGRPDGEETQYSRPIPAIVLPKADETQNPEWRPIANPLDLLMKVLDTARENHDNVQSMLPGYRERIVQVRFAVGEGGLNLAMSPDTIERIRTKGETAADKLLCDFDFDQHRWTRFLSLMALLENQLEMMDGAFRQQSANNEWQNYKDLLASQKFQTEVPRPANPNFIYNRDRQWLDQADKMVEELLTVVNCWKNAEATRIQLAQIGTAQPLTNGHSNHDEKMDECDKHATQPALHFFDSKSHTRRGETLADHDLYACPKPNTALRVTPRL
jgi:hypothetical protein